MAEETLLSDDYVRQLTAVGEVDVIVGIPTLNHRGSVAPVINAVKKGLATYFRRERAAVIVSEGGLKNEGTETMTEDAGAFTPFRSEPALRRHSGHRPLNRGRRFSMKAVRPSA